MRGREIGFFVRSVDELTRATAAVVETVGDEADLEEVYETERHPLYVACTRAREHLRVSGVGPGSEFFGGFGKRQPYALEPTETAADFAEALVQDGPLPERAALDALHISAAVSGGMDDLLTWNLRHLANATMRSQIERMCRSRGTNRRSSARRKN